MKRILLLCLLLLAGIFSASAQSKEYLVVTGGVSLNQWEKYKAQPHDGWWLNFIRAARIRFEQLRAEGVPPEQITWMVYSPAYKRRQSQEADSLFSIINSVRDAYGVRLIYFDSGKDVINYINSGQPRDRVKLSGFEYFGHSNKAAFMFDYSNYIDSASKAWLHENELGQIRPSAFAPDAYIKSWGCYTGESMGLKWRKAVGLPMWGAVGKTQYQTDQLPIPCSAGGRWVN